jgi:hypothetical protein
LGVVFISAVGLTAETNRFQYNAIQLMRDTKFELDTAVESASIMVLILSSWSSQAAEKRQVLRDSALRWTTGANITYRFVLGQPPSSNAQSWMGPKLVSESEKYNDLLVVPAPDLQSDKSKKLLEALKWSVQADYDYLIKTDDDVFVRWDLIPFELKNQKKENYWKGFVYR